MGVIALKDGVTFLAGQVAGTNMYMKPTRLVSPCASCLKDVADLPKLGKPGSTPQNRGDNLTRTSTG
jgi:hypothetical protein